jgi:hypothetical protein
LDARREVHISTNKGSITMRSLFAVITVILSLFLTGCDDEKALIGSWRCTSTDLCSGVWTFNADHTLTISYEDMQSIFKNKVPQGRPSPLAGRATAATTVTWKLDSSKKPNQLTLTITNGVDTLRILAIQEFTSKKGMRIGADYFEMPPPSGFDTAGTIWTFERV